MDREKAWDKLEEVGYGEKGQAPGSEEEVEIDEGDEINEMEVDNELIHIHPTHRFE